MSFQFVYKKRDKNNLGNYRPVSLTSIVCKLLERAVVFHISKHLSNILVDGQHGFRSGQSCTTQLVTTMDEVMKSF